MGDVVRSATPKAQARLQLVRRATALHGCDPPRCAPYAATVSPDQTCAQERLISPYDAVISRTLREQTQFVLATLTPRERFVLRLRFGIPQTGDQLSEIDEVLAPGDIAFIEAAALRKLRDPNHGVRLRSVDGR